MSQQEAPESAFNSMFVWNEFLTRCAPCSLMRSCRASHLQKAGVHVPNNAQIGGMVI